MKPSKSTLVALITLIAVALLAEVPAQHAVPAQHTRYKLIDIGTFGGQNSSPAFQPFFDFTTAQNLSSAGTFIGQAEVSPGGTCFLYGDCGIHHAFRWRNGVLTDLSSLGEGLSSATQWISGNGLIAGVSEYIDPATSAVGTRGVLWRKGESVNLGTLPQATRVGREIGFPDSIAFAVNNNEQIVGMSTNDTADPNPNMFTDTIGDPEPRAVLWQGGQIRDLGTLGGTDSLALLINQQGQVVGQSYTADTRQPAPSCGGGVPLNLHGFIWENGLMSDIGTLGGSCAFTYALNNRGQIVGQSALTGDAASHPYLWDREAGMIDLFQREGGSLGGTYGYGQWINDHGVIIGNVTDQGDQRLLAVSWTPDGVIHNLGTLGGDPCSVADAINSHGSIVGGSGFFAALSFPACTTTNEHAFLWENGSMVDLNSFVPLSSDLTLTEAVFINDRGEISGFGTNADGDQHAFLLIPCGPEETAGCMSASLNVPGASRTSTGHIIGRPGNPSGPFRHLLRRRLGVGQLSGTSQKGALSATQTSKPTATLTPTSLAFQCRNVINAGCECITERTTTLSDAGSTALKINNITVSGPFSETNDCGTSLAAGASCTITVHWSQVNSNGAVYVKDNAIGSPQTVSLTSTKYCTPP